MSLKKIFPEANISLTQSFYMSGNSITWSMKIIAPLIQIALGSINIIILCFF